LKISIITQYAKFKNTSSNAARTVLDLLITVIKLYTMHFQFNIKI